MKYAKIIVKSEYENKEDFVHRPFIKAVEKIGAYAFLEDNKAIILGRVINGHFYELFTNILISTNNYEKIKISEVKKVLTNIDMETLSIVSKVIRFFIFHEPVDIKEENISEAMEYEDFERNLSNISLYSENRVEENKHFFVKCRM